ncbi:MAG: cytochrome ubiquinol oxidase subunit I [Deltaproteobacteria bacterium]|nr:cytochrome ubiquinol oxidase subunit I [Deltaproteobacteria bacterium]
MLADTLLFSRLQFALTVGFHFLFPPITIGMAWLIALMLWRALRTGDPVYRQMARFWLRVFALTFGMGVATGIAMEFQFGTNWARYSRFVGDIFGAPLAAEAILAFFLESTFLGVLLFGERRVAPRTYALSALLVAVGSTLSGLWIIIANSWQQTPAGYRLVAGRAELADAWAAFLNPSTVPRFLHTIDGALITGAFFVMGLSAWFLLHGRHQEFARRSLRMALLVGLLAAAAQWPLGHLHAVQVSQTQPAKLAAFEGLWDTRPAAPFLLFGIPDAAAERTGHAVALPGMLSIVVGGSTDTVVRGLKDFPRKDRPPLLPTFASFHLMVALGGYFTALAGLGLLLLLRRRLFDSRWFLYAALWSLPLPLLANELGWMAAEIGRQPWIVYGLLRTDEAFSEAVPAGQVLASLVVFGATYALLFAVWLTLLRRKLRQGPEPPDGAGEGYEEAARPEVGA